MQALMRTAFLIIVLYAVVSNALAQSPPTKQKESSATISGRVSIGEKPAPGITIMLIPGATYYDPQAKVVARAVTDQDGRYRLTGVPAGRYIVMPQAAAFVGAGVDDPRQPAGSRAIIIETGEAVEGIDFTLTRGAVITGRITDADGRPVVEEVISLTRLDERGQKFSSSSGAHMTDDRGVYRIYGLSEGRYLVSVGRDKDSGIFRVGRATGYYARTFHPGTTNEAEAKIVEVAPGSEAANVDIALGRRSETYAVSGRVVDAETGKPVPNVRYVFGALSKDGNEINNYGSNGGRTNDLGEFHMEGVTPGHYVAFVMNDDGSNAYSDAARFEIIDGDVSGLVVKTHRGATISGVAVIEGTNNRAILAMLPQLGLGISVTTRELSTPDYRRQTINADGSFRIGGVRPGKAVLYLGGTQYQKGFLLLRVERDGVEQRDGLEIGQSEQEITGVRVVIGYGTGVIRGQVQVQGGKLPDGMRLRGWARPISEARTQGITQVVVDARGRFIIEGLLGGEYELRLNAYSTSVRTPSQHLPTVTKTVSVTDGAESTVTIVLDLNAKRSTP